MRDIKFAVVMSITIIAMVIAMAFLARGCTKPANASPNYRPFEVWPVKYGNHCALVFTTHSGSGYGRNVAAIRVPCQAKLQLLNEEGPL